QYVGHGVGDAGQRLGRLPQVHAAHVVAVAVQPPHQVSAQHAVTTGDQDRAHHSDDTFPRTNRVSSLGRPSRSVAASESRKYSTSSSVATSGGPTTSGFRSFSA